MAAAILLLFVFGKMGENPVLSFKQELEAAFLEGGAAAAKERFLKEHEQRKDERLSHELAHWLGAQYYLAEGREGVRFCDETAGFGCFHGFYGMAFANEQDNFLKSASEFCGLDEDRVRFAECVHGIGHGVLVNIG
ncbi:MAG: hypothetical protein Q8P12_06625 [bacterium]|nr:hypothetical protein [bacterium]